MLIVPVVSITTVEFRLAVRDYIGLHVVTLLCMAREFVLRTHSCFGTELTMMRGIVREKKKEEIVMVDYTAYTTQR